MKMRLPIAVFLCVYISGVIARSARSAERHSGNVTGNCDIVRPFFDSKNVTIDFSRITKEDVAASKMIFI